MTLIDVEHGQQSFRRDRSHIISGGMDQYFLRLFLSGGHQGFCGERPISSNTGDICIFDLARPFSGSAQQGAMFSLLLPRAAIDKVTGGRDLHGLLLKAGAPITRFLTDFLISFDRLSRETEGASIESLDETAISLIGTCLSHEAPAAPDPALAHVLRHRLLHFIDANLAVPDLGPALLMQRFQVSRAHLYRMFAAESGVATIIREKRLDAAFHALTSSRAQHQSVAEIAHAFGFSSATQFHRAFRARFSITPHQARSEPIADAKPWSSSLQGLLDHYLRHLSFDVSQIAPANES